MAQAPVSHRRQQHGWETTSDDYHVHVAAIARMPSTLHNVPRYPSVHKVFKNKVQEPDQEPNVQKQETTPSNKSQKKVQMAEKEQIIYQDEKDEDVEENIDSETSCFIQQKRKAFELCKWKSFKMDSNI